MYGEKLIRHPVVRIGIVTTTQKPTSINEYLYKQDAREGGW